ncbi:MAG: hypothetical protein LBM60_08550 [Clostridium sp.]|jgi:beta-lactamase regulating signal transducer with metallopeptidase domain|nr:hypothetical protein [Clostridium sp.]
MGDFFLQILNMSLVASIVIGAVMLIRLPLKKVPKWISYALWAVVGFRLVCPFSIESPISFMPVRGDVIDTGSFIHFDGSELPKGQGAAFSTDPFLEYQATDHISSDGANKVADNIASGETGMIVDNTSSDGANIVTDNIASGETGMIADNTLNSEPEKVTDKNASGETGMIADNIENSDNNKATDNIASGTPGMVADNTINGGSDKVTDNNASGNLGMVVADNIENDTLGIILYFASWVWLIGIEIMLLRGFVQTLKLKRRLRGSYEIEPDLFEFDIKTPFLLGLLRPIIYIPAMLEGEERRYVILHERAHLHRGDHWVKFGAYLILCLHWFNPLVWFAFILMSADMEMSCDERVMKELGSQMKKAYSRSLLSLASKRRVIAGSPLAFGESGVKARILNIINFKKPSRFIIVIAMFFTVIVSVGFAMDRVQKPLQNDGAPAVTKTVPDEKRLLTNENGALAPSQSEESTIPTVRLWEFDWTQTGSDEGFRQHMGAELLPDADGVITLTEQIFIEVNIPDGTSEQYTYRMEDAANMQPVKMMGGATNIASNALNDHSLTGNTLAIGDYYPNGYEGFIWAVSVDENGVKHESERIRVRSNPLQPDASYYEFVGYPYLSVYVHANGCMLNIRVPQDLAAKVQTALDAGIPFTGIKKDNTIIPDTLNADMRLPHIFYYTDEEHYSVIGNADGQWGLIEGNTTIEATDAVNSLFDLAGSYTGWNFDTEVKSFTDISYIYVMLGDEVLNTVEDAKAIARFEDFMQHDTVTYTASNTQEQIIEIRCIREDGSVVSIFADPWNEMLWIPPFEYKIYGWKDNADQLRQALGIDPWPSQVIPIRDIQDGIRNYPDGFFDAAMARVAPPPDF